MRAPFGLLVKLSAFLGHRPEDAVTAADLQRLLLNIQKDIATMSDSMQTAIDTLTADVAAQTTVEASMETFITGLSAKLTAAVAAAAAGGATAAQLADLVALDVSVKANTAAIVIATTENTPAA